MVVRMSKLATLGTGATGVFVGAGLILTFGDILRGLSLDATAVTAGSAVVQACAAVVTVGAIGYVARLEHRRHAQTRRETRAFHAGRLLRTLDAVGRTLISVQPIVRNAPFNYMAGAMRSGASSALATLAAAVDDAAALQASNVLGRLEEALRRLLESAEYQFYDFGEDGNATEHWSTPMWDGEELLTPCVEAHAALADLARHHLTD